MADQVIGPRRETNTIILLNELINKFFSLESWVGAFLNLHQKSFFLQETDLYRDYHWFRSYIFIMIWIIYIYNDLDVSGNVWL